MEQLDLKGIVWIPARKKYRVLLTRKGVEYVIGHYIELSDAVIARDIWLDEYSKANFYDINEPPKYSKEWYRYMHKKNLEAFKKYNEEDTGIKFCTVDYDESEYGVSMKMRINDKHRHDNDNYWANFGVDTYYAN